MVKIINEYTIRLFMHRDMDPISDILKRIGWAHQSVEGERKSIESLKDAEDGEVFVAIRGVDIAGFIHVQHLRWNQLSYIHCLAVSPDCRREGVALQLTSHIEQIAQARGNRGVFMDTPIDNHGAIAFYEAQAYAEAYIMPSYYEDGVDGVAYIKLFKT